MTPRDHRLETPARMSADPSACQVLSTPTHMLRLCCTILWCVLLAGLSSCGPPLSAPASDDRNLKPDDAALLDTLERRVAESIAQVRESAVALEYAVADGSSGARRVATGVVIDDEGEVLSIRVDRPPPSAPIVARDASGGRHPVRWVAADAETGLTLLQIAPKIARPVRPATRAPRLGSQVLVVGNPFGLGHSVIRGQVAGLNRRLDLGPRPLGGLIQIDAALHPGDSGALVANLLGEWLGLIRSGLATPGAGRAVDHDLGFAIPARDALWIADQLRMRHRVDRAYLGVRLVLGPANPSDVPGAVLESVLADTPAARAGLEAGDRVVTLDGHSIDSAGDLTDRLDRTPANADAAFEVLRGSTQIVRTVRTGRRPPVKAGSSSSSSKDEESPPPALSEISDRLDRLERRIRVLEKQSKPAPQP